MKLIQMIIVTSTYLTIAIAIMVFIQGLVYQLSGKKVNLWNKAVNFVHRHFGINTNDRRKLKYVEVKEYRKVG